MHYLVRFRTEKLADIDYVAGQERVYISPEGGERSKNAKRGLVNSSVPSTSAPSRSEAPSERRRRN